MVAYWQDDPRVRLFAPREATPAPVRHLTAVSVFPLRSSKAPLTSPPRRPAKGRRGGEVGACG